MADAPLNCWPLPGVAWYADYGASEPVIRFLHVVVHRVEDCRLDEESLAAIHAHPIAASQQLGALALAGINVAKDGIHLLLADDGAQPRFWIERVAGFQLTGALNQLGHEFIVNFLFHE